mmetsp:Transcript_44835/g.113570  ORF Transcript_44835/g.113570 Transcript_44835/m.113570 type:complete len:251 (-) Transcript_44835:72-824(-)
MGSVAGANGGGGGGRAALTPIMAHPPSRVSDLSFGNFLEAFISDGRRHLKLDFKELAALQACAPLLAAQAPRLARNGQAVMLNADIVPGPGRRHRLCAVPAEEFFKVVLAHCPGIPLSLGWTVCTAACGSGYREADCQGMLAVYESYENRLDVPAGGVVFAVSLRLAARCFRRLAALLRATPGSQLLLWTGCGERSVPKGMVQRLRSEIRTEGLCERVGFDCKVASWKLQAVGNETTMCIGGVLNWLDLV